MSSQEEEIKQLLALLAIYRRTIAHLLQQAAQYGGESFAPPLTANAITEARANIQRIENTLHDLGVDEATFGKSDSDKITKFERFFRASKQSNQVGIVVPRFPVKRLFQFLNDNKKDPNRFDLDETKATKTFGAAGSGDDSILSYADIKAAYDIILLFSQHHLPLPEIVWDDRDNIDQDTQYKSLIVIGLTSNRYFWNVHRNKDVYKSFFVSKSRKYMTNSIKMDEKIYKTGKEKDYALIARAILGNKTYLLVGGLNAQGTRMIGGFLQERWEKLHDYHDNTRNLIVADRPFSAIIGFHPRDNHLGSLTVEEVEVLNTSR